MAYIQVDDNPSLNLNMDSFETTTPVHCDQMNPRHKQHLNNEKALLAQVKLKADIASPTFTGTPKAPTATTTDNSTQVATTAFVKAQGYVAANSGDTAATVVSAMDTISTEFPEPAAGEPTKTLWGKVKKFIQDMNNLRASMLFIGSIVNNCVTSNSALPLSAAQGKVLMDLYTQLNSDLSGRFKRGLLTVAAPGNVITNQTVTFSAPMKTVPSVSATLYGDTTSTLYGSLGLIVINVTVNGFTIRVANNTNTAMSPGVSWVAVCD